MTNDDTLRHAIASHLHPLAFSAAEERSPDRVKRMYARQREDALRQADEVLDIVAQHTEATTTALVLQLARIEIGRLPAASSERKKLRRMVACLSSRLSTPEGE